jgi:hypothetical protein
MQSVILDEVRVDRGRLGDTYQPTLAVKYSLTNVAGETTGAQKNGATITIAPTGGTGSKLLVTLKTVAVDESGTETTTTNSLNGATYTTLKSLVDAINAIAGFTAYVLHAPHSLSTNSDDFIALSETAIRCDGKPLECLYRDVSETITDVTGNASRKCLYFRVGNPEPQDTGRMRLIGLNGTSTGVTSGTVKVFRDAYSQGGTAEELLSFAQVAAETAYVNHTIREAVTYRGPLLVEVSSTDLSAGDIKVRTCQAEW